MSYYQRKSEGIQTLSESAIEALSKIDDPRVVEPLIKCADSIDVGSLTYTNFLKRLDDPQAVKMLVQELKYRCCLTMENALLDLGAIAIGPLITALNDSDGNIRKRALSVLEKAERPEVIEHLHNMLGDKVFI